MAHGRLPSRPPCRWAAVVRRPRGMHCLHVSVNLHLLLLPCLALAPIQAALRCTQLHLAACS